MTTSLVFMI